MLDMPPDYNLHLRIKVLSTPRIFFSYSKTDLFLPKVEKAVTFLHLQAADIMILA